MRDLELRGMFDARSLRELAGWPGLWNLDRLELHAYQRIEDAGALAALAHSPYLCPLTRVRLNAVAIPPEVRRAFLDRLGRRFRS